MAAMCVRLVVKLMKNDVKSKVKKFVAFIIIASFLSCVSYLLVYQASILPNGYDIEAVQKDVVSLKSFNFLGIEKDIITRSFSSNEAWKIDDITYEVSRQKKFLWLMYSFVTISIFLVIYKVRNGSKVLKAVVESNLIFAILLPLFPVINSVNRIQMLIL